MLEDLRKFGMTSTIYIVNCICYIAKDAHFTIVMCWRSDLLQFVRFIIISGLSTKLINMKNDGIFTQNIWSGFFYIIKWLLELKFCTTFIAVIKRKSMTDYFLLEHLKIYGVTPICNHYPTRQFENTKQIFEVSKKLTF